MSREPLMLSDTAMVLLQEYVELKNQVGAVSHAFREGLSRFRSYENEEVKRLSESLYAASASLPPLIASVEIGLLQELRVLWIFPDVMPIRHRDWHVVFNERLMAIAETLLVVHPRRQGFQTINMRRMQSEFMSQLAVAYEVALSARKTEKDGS